ncbi:MAG: ribosome recycling factor [Candidatus Magasanikbacteria bacterium]
MGFVKSNIDLFDKAIEFLKQDISNLRTGRATPALVEDISVEAYGTRQPLKAVASISVADAKTINVEPWDKSLTLAVETAIRNSDIGINPVNDGKLIRLPLPELNAERRQELIKVLHKKLEQSRISLRKIREDVRTEIDKLEKAKAISEDDKFIEQEDLEKIVKDYNDKVKEIGEEKEREITTI